LKGPGRHRYAVRRLWQCPLCQRRELTDGDVVALQCSCLARANPPARTWMKLLEEPRRPAAVPAVAEAPAIPAAPEGPAISAAPEASVPVATPEEQPTAQP
jgi:hypothetical protein